VKILTKTLDLKFIRLYNVQTCELLSSGRVTMTQSKITGIHEDYLETIYLLETERGTARVTDIARNLTRGKSAVTMALKRLRARGLVF
jgi:DNA-binding MarR family transcriptional regulator